MIKAWMAANAISYSASIIHMINPYPKSAINLKSFVYNFENEYKKVTIFINIIFLYHFLLKPNKSGLYHVYMTSMFFDFWHVWRCITITVDLYQYNHPTAHNQINSIWKWNASIAFYWGRLNVALEMRDKKVFWPNHVNIGWFQINSGFRGLFRNNWNAELHVHVLTLSQETTQTIWAKPIHCLLIIQYHEHHWIEATSDASQGRPLRSASRLELSRRVS